MESTFVFTVTGLSRYFPSYNTERRHQGLESRTPAHVYFGSKSGVPRIWAETRTWLINDPGAKFWRGAELKC
jgi:hypothetical protein